MQVTVVFPVTVDLDAEKIEVDKKRCNDVDYMEEIKNQIKDIAAEILRTSTIKPILRECDECPELID